MSTTWSNDKYTGFLCFLINFLCVERNNLELYETGVGLYFAPGWREGDGNPHCAEWGKINPTYALQSQHSCRAAHRMKQCVIAPLLQLLQNWKPNISLKMLILLLWNTTSASLNKQGILYAYQFWDANRSLGVHIDTPFNYLVWIRNIIRQIYHHAYIKKWLVSLLIQHCAIESL